jgi:TrkA-N domain
MWLAERPHDLKLTVPPRRIPLPNQRRPLWRSILLYATGLLRTPDTGTRMLLLGLHGVLAILVADWAWLLIGKHDDPATALLEAVCVVTTVGPAPQGHGLYAALSAAAMLITVLLTAMLTAGFVDRLLSPRLVGLIGPRVLPRSGHVIVIGMGQVGLRLCRELTALGVDVVAVERNPAAENLRLVRALRIPRWCVIGLGSRQLALGECCARQDSPNEPSAGSAAGGVERLGVDPVQQLDCHEGALVGPHFTER